jgi:hypothetical protein
MVCLNAFHHRVFFFFDVSFTQRILMSASYVHVIYIVIQCAFFPVILLTFVSLFGSTSMNFHNMKLMRVSSCNITAHVLKFAQKNLKSVHFSIFFTVYHPHVLMVSVDKEWIRKAMLTLELGSALHCIRNG